jgi:glucosamine-phosphate N-acetyltransferase
MLRTASPHNLEPELMDIHIRELEAPDFRRGFLETLGGLAEIGLTPEEAEAVWRSPQRSHTTTWVAVYGDRVVGTATLIVEQKFIHRGGLVGHIEDVAVHRDFRRCGIGSRLVGHATEQAVIKGCYKVILNCHDPVQPFYRQLGYYRHDYGMRYDARKE